MQQEGENDMNAHEVKALEGMSRVMARFRRLNERYPIQQIHLLLVLALAEAKLEHPREGVENLDLQKQAGTRDTSHSGALAGLTGHRAQRGLGAKGRADEEPLVERFQSPGNFRSIRLRLTPAGRHLVREVIGDLDAPRRSD
jgi:DNA-binding MarR family transcriptional regulator